MRGGWRHPERNTAADEMMTADFYFTHWFPCCLPELPAAPGPPGPERTAPAQCPGLGLVRSRPGSGPGSRRPLEAVVETAVSHRWSVTACGREALTHKDGH